MSEHVDQNTQNDVVVENRPVDGIPFISWGAIIAGLVVILSLAWIFHLLGLAMGVSIADATDSVTMEGGLTTATTIWVIFSWLAAIFIGSLVTSRLAGHIDELSGMLHGLVLWAVATVMMLVLGFWGLSSLLQTGVNIVSATAKTATSVVSETATSVPAVATQSAELLETDFANTLQNRLEEQAVTMVANSDKQLSKSEIRTAINDLDERTLRRISQDLVSEDTDGAAELLAENTELSKQDANALIDSAYEELEELIGNPDNDQPLTQDLQNELARQVDGYIEELDAQGGPDVEEADIRQAIASIEPDEMQQFMMEVVNGNPERAKRVISRNTELSSAEIDELYEGAATGIEDEIDEYQQAWNDAVETTSTYLQQALWTCFSAAAIGLAVSMLGGWVGVDSIRRHRDS